MKLQPQLEALARRERLTGVRNWCFGLGLVITVLAITAFGPTTIGNPKTWMSAYHAFAAVGILGWFAVSLLGLGAVLLLAALVLSIQIKGCWPRNRHENSDPSR